MSQGKWSTSLLNLVITVPAYFWPLILRTLQGSKSLLLSRLFEFRFGRRIFFAHRSISSSRCVVTMGYAFTFSFCTGFTWSFVSLSLSVLTQPLQPFLRCLPPVWTSWKRGCEPRRGKLFPWLPVLKSSCEYIDGLIRKRRSSSANAPELRLFCFKPSVCRFSVESNWVY